jgi:cysteine desulfurase
VLQPVAQVAALAREQGVARLHCDATQVAGKLPLDFAALGVDMMTISAHKFGGPQGAGALIVRPGLKLEPLLAGGPQEQQRRAGTENAALIAGFGKAAEQARNQLPERQAFLLELRTHFEARLKEIDGVVIFGEAAERLPNTSFFAIPYYHGETLLMELDRAGFALASGSACHSEVTRPSHVLTAMGVDEALALNAVRASFGMDNSPQQVDRLIDELRNRINALPPAMRQHG